MNAIRVETCGTVRSKWGEGPIWWSDFLYYVDIEGKMVIRYHPESGEEKCWSVGQRVGTVVPRQGGGLLCAGDDGFFFLEEETGVCTPICDPESHMADNRFNDGKCAPDGCFFAGSISLVRRTGDAKLYRLAPDLTCTVAYEPVTTSNGIIWSADAKTCYYIDTPRRCVLAFDYQDGELMNCREVINTKSIDASPDGMTIDDEGNLWVAFCHGACVVCYHPATAEELVRIDFECLETTACAFGGPDLADLYVTTGIHKSVVEADGGRLFVVKGLGRRGVKANAFVG